MVDELLVAYETVVEVEPEYRAARRLANKPLHALLGTGRKKKIVRYGDVRWQGSDMTPEGYAKQVASYLERTGMIATKLHFPGNMGNEDSMPLKDILNTLTGVRKAVGDDKILAWDPYPRKAESATTSLNEAKAMIRHMDDLDYAKVRGDPRSTFTGPGHRTPTWSWRTTTRSAPIAEFPVTEDVPKSYLDGPYLLAPDWPGIYCID